MMSISSGTTSADTQTTEAGARQPMVADPSRRLQQAFGVEFSLLDGHSGETLHGGAEPPGGNWGLWGELAREVARRKQPELLAEEDPFVVLAIPFGADDSESLVAVAPFVCRPLREEEDVSQAAGLLGYEPSAAARWAGGQSPWAPDALMRTGCLVQSQWESDQRIDRLQEEANSLSDHLASTFEEISLLHRLTQNLKISKSDEELGRIALEWLGEVLPAEGIALELVPVAQRDDFFSHGARTESVLLTRGRCPVDLVQFHQIVDHLRPEPTNRPLVANPSVTGRAGWPVPQVRQLILVPLAEGRNVFGWLGAFNHTGGREFGSVEASLLSSVGAILGIHSGNIELYRQQSELMAGVVRALTSAIDAKDPYTCGHSDRVARVAVRLAEEIGVDAESLRRIYLSGLLHDIGKIGIDDNVLRKPGKLTEAEYEHIKTHACIGHTILLDLKKLDDVLPVVLHHHESWDGHGYPGGLTEEQIPLAARIVAVADAFDAMGSDRPYREGMPDEKIDGIFRAGAGSQWDPGVVEAFFRVREDLRAIVSREEDDFQVNMQQFS